MRRFSHWTPVYIYHRLQDVIYRNSHPTAPWLTPAAIEFLTTVVRSEDIGLEYGSGRSTTWFAARVKKLVSVEHNSDWHKRVGETIRQLGLNNIEYHLHPQPGAGSNLPELLTSTYVMASDTLQPDSLDFVLVDGIIRPACAIRAIPLLKKGAWLILDDANHYLPSLSKAPNSRNLTDGPLNEQWKEVEQAVAGWKTTWFGNGIKETLIFQKPG
jgi:predicted O-methyltransferase YrrM